MYGSQQKIWGFLIILAGFATLFFPSAIQAQSPNLTASETAGVRQLLSMARIAIQSKRFNEARHHLDEVKKKLKNSRFSDLDALETQFTAAKKERIRWLLDKAFTAKSKKSNTDAKKQFREVLLLDPGNAEAEAGLLEVQKDLKAVEDYKKAGVVVSESTGQGEDPNAYSIGFLMMQAIAKKRQGKLAEAHEKFLEILARQPTNIEAQTLANQVVKEQYLNDLVENAEANFKSQKLFQAVGDFDLLVQENPDRIDYFFKRGKALLGLARYSEAIRDFHKVLLWKPPPGNKDLAEFEIPRSEVLPVLSKAYFGNEEPLHAYAASFDPSTGRAYQPLSFRWSCRFKAYPMTWSLLAILFSILLGSLYWTWTQFDAVVGIVPPNDIWELGKWFLLSHVFGRLPPLKNLGTLRTSGRLAVISYVLGLSLIQEGRYEKALEKFQYCYSHPGFAPRCYFFLALIRREMKQTLFEHDFEQMIILTMKDPPIPFLPAIYRKLEQELIESLGKTSSVEESALAKKAHEIFFTYLT